MAQFHCKEENRASFGRSVLSDPSSSFGNSPLVDSVAREPTTETGERLSADFSTLECAFEQETGDRDDSLRRLEGDRFRMDVSSAVRSLALKGSLDFGKLRSLPQLFSAASLEERDSSLPPLDVQDRNAEGEVEPVEKQVLRLSFQSKYIHIFPLYQEYNLQAVRNELHRIDKTSLSELIAPQCLQGLRSRLGPRLHSASALAQLHPPEATTPPPPSPPTQPRRVTPCTLWQDLEEVKASGLLGSLTAREVRLQESIFELIGSEASYLRSLGVAVDHFHASKALKRSLSQMEHHILFSNIRRVMAASERFLMDLEMRLGESVLISQAGDIVLQHCPEFHRLYVPYVTNMMYQEALVNQLLQHNREFLHSLKKLESDPLCQRQNLKSFLVLPFQRITRTKLLLENIRKLTEPESASISNLEKAIEAVHEIVVDCDRGVRKMKLIEALVSLETLLDFGKVKSVPLVVSGRFLVHQGPMRQLSVEGTSRPSFLSVYLHLFNDLLIVSSKKDQQFIVLDHAEFPTHVRVEHLKTEVMSLPPDSFLLHLSHSQTGHPTAMILVTDTRSDKEAWIKMLSSKQ